MSILAYIGFGSNLGDRFCNYQTALAKLKNLSGVAPVHESKLYQSEPLTEGQPWYLNAAFEIVTSQTLRDLFCALRNIEKEMGREKRTKWESRIVDLDILFYGDLVFSDAEIRVPHKEIPNRRFVLLPLKDLNPELIHPEFKVTVTELLENMDNKLKGTVEKYRDPRGGGRRRVHHGAEDETRIFGHSSHSLTESEHHGKPKGDRTT